jgi:hypothetical protein
MWDGLGLTVEGIKKKGVICAYKSNIMLEYLRQLWKEGGWVGLTRDLKKVQYLYMQKRVNIINRVFATAVEGRGLGGLYERLEANCFGVLILRTNGLSG